MVHGQGFVRHQGKDRCVSHDLIGVLTGWFSPAVCVCGRVCACSPVCDSSMAAYAEVVAAHVCCVAFKAVCALCVTAAWFLSC